jgi:hypothetical protein
MDSAEKQDDQNSSDNSVSETSTELLASWNDSQELLLKSIAERSNCMRWLHTQCNLYFENMNFYLTIPNVVISTLNGSFTMSLTSLFPDPGQKKYATTIIGLISILSAVLITMNQYVKSQQMSEAHRSAGLSYGKLYRHIMNELSMRRDQRSNGLDFLKYVRIEIDRLENTAPSILPYIILKFNIQFANREIEKPEITGDLDIVQINKELKQTKSSNAIVQIVRSASDIFFQGTPTPSVKGNSMDKSLEHLKPSNVLRSSNLGVKEGSTPISRTTTKSETKVAPPPIKVAPSINSAFTSKAPKAPKAPTQNQIVSILESPTETILENSVYDPPGTNSDPTHGMTITIPNSTSLSSSTIQQNNSS